MIIDVRGKPAPQGSKRHVGGGRMIEQSKAVGPWREAVRAQTQLVAAGPPWEGPVEVFITFTLNRPASHYRTGQYAHLVRGAAPAYPAGRPDVDKLARAVLDGLTAGGAWKDDSQVVVLTVSKVYADDGQPSGCTIVLREAT
jgi:crossover junction endodeoxyribonuclease RusA